jgi:hypothetical protein
MPHHEVPSGLSGHFKSETTTESRSSPYVRQVPPLSSVNCTVPAISAEMFTAVYSYLIPQNYNIM